MTTAPEISGPVPRYRTKAFNSMTGEPLSDSLMDNWVEKTIAALNALVSEMPESRVGLDRWIDRGVAVLFRCPLCVRREASMEESADIARGQSASVHVPDGAEPGPSDRISVYWTCRRHGASPAVPEAVRWWATRDGESWSGRVVIFLPKPEVVSG